MLIAAVSVWAAISSRVANMRKRAKKLTTGGLTAAASVVALYLASVVPTMTIALTAIAGVLLVFDIVRYGRVFSFGVYAVTCILAFLLLPSKIPAVWFALLFGIYPILKHIFEGCRSRGVEWLLKVLYVIVVLSIMLFALKVVLPLPAIVTEHIVLVYPIFLVAFFIYDIAFSRLIGELIRRFPKS